MVTRGVDRGSGLRPVNEVHQWGHGSHVPSRVNFNSVIGGGSSSRWQTHDARVDVTDVAAAKFHNLALSSVGQVFTWGFGADNLGEGNACMVTSAALTFSTKCVRHMRSPPGSSHCRSS